MLSTSIPEDESTDTQLLLQCYLIHSALLQGRQAEAATQYAQLQEQMEPWSRYEPHIESPLFSLVSSCYIGRAWYPSTLPLIYRYLYITEALNGEESESLAQARFRMAPLVREICGGEDPDEWERQAMGFLQRALPEDDPALAAYLHAILKRHCGHRSFEEFKPLAQRLLALYERTQMAEPPEMAFVLTWLAMDYNSRGNKLAATQFAQYLALLQRALKIRENTLGPDARPTVESRANLGIFYHDQECHTEALPYLEQALQDAEGYVSSDEHIQGLIASLGRTYEALGRYAEAETMYARVWQHRRKTRGEEDVRTYESTQPLVTLYSKQQRYTEAESVLLRFMPAYERAQGSRPQEPNGDPEGDMYLVMRWKVDMACLYEEWRRLEDAEIWWQRVVTEPSSDTPQHNSSYFFTFMRRASYYYRKGRYAETASYLRPLMARYHDFPGISSDTLYYPFRRCADCYEKMQDTQSLTALTKEYPELYAQWVEEQLKG